ncbi:MAG: hypothetical protein ACTJG4_11695 [Vreelandella alkaliphila]|uniref:hypothetical protein n=1 Tax=Halomonadaceae TaxID=28256 RepID=UPI000E98DEA2|nr:MULTISPECIES: hypothetical protein [unclassified Halomonas]HBP41447.1 hypothetical protein [Halomonas sp.]
MPLLEPFACMMQVYLQMIEGQQPHPEWDARLAPVSVKKAHYAEGKPCGRQGRSDAADEAYQAIGSPVTELHHSP